MQRQLGPTNIDFIVCNH